MKDRAEKATEDCARAWQYYSAADTLLIARLQSLLFAHSFLVVAFAGLMTIPSESWWVTVGTSLICVTGVFTAALVWKKNASLARGLAALKGILVTDHIYRAYDAALQEKGFWGTRVFTALWPLLLIIVWAVLCALGVAKMYGVFK